MGYDKNANYCTMFPDSIAGVNYKYGCYLHDRHYRNERKVRLSRKDSDILLRDVVYRKFEEKDKKIIGFIVSRLMYVGVRLFAKLSWVKEINQVGGEK